MPKHPRLRWSRSPVRPALLLCLTALVILAGCSSLVEGQPSPTPLDFGGITVTLARAGIVVAHTVSGDAGCSDPNLIPTAIAFDASGADQATPVHLRIYIFSSRAAFDRRRADVDTCATAWATDPATFETVDATPFVVAGQGPWAPGFKTALAAALKAAAGNGD